MGKKGEDTKTLIRKAATLLFAQKGFKEVTMKDICQNTGLSRGGLYRHYNSTHHIFTEIVDEMMAVQNDEFSSMIESGVSAVFLLNAVLERYRMEMLDSENSLSLAIYEYCSGMPDSNNLLSKQYEYAHTMWTNLVQYGIHTNEFNTVDIDAVVDLLIFSYQGVRMYGRIEMVDEKIPARIVNQIKAILLKKGK